MTTARSSSGRRAAAAVAAAAVLLGACAGAAGTEEATAPASSRLPATIVAADTVVGTTQPAPAGTTEPASTTTTTTEVPTTTTARPRPTQPAPAPSAIGPVAGVPARLAPPGGIALPGAENVPFAGFWHPIGPLVGGSSAMYATSIPAAPGSGAAVGVAWIDPGAIRAQFQPGTTDPPGPWGTPSYVLADWQSTLAAVFNGGFKSKDSRGGMFLEGRANPPLRPGAASAVITTDGVLTVGQWGRDVEMNASVSAVRQNLDLMVDGNRNLAVDNGPWGATLNSAVRVPRSGLGIRSDGSVIYAGGPDMTAREMGDVLVAAGCMRAMELDINAQWVTFTSFTWDAATSTPQGTKLNDRMTQSTARFLGADERDFFSLFVR